MIYLSLSRVSRLEDDGRNGNGIELELGWRVQARDFHVVNLSRHFFHVALPVNVSSVTDPSTWQKCESARLHVAGGCRMVSGEFASACILHYSVDATSSYCKWTWTFTIIIICSKRFNASLSGYDDVGGMIC